MLASPSKPEESNINQVKQDSLKIDSKIEGWDQDEILLDEE